MTTKTSPTIRPFRRKDATRLAGMMQKLAAFHGEKAQSKPADFLIHALGRQKIAHAWLAWRDGQAAGFLIAYDRMNFVSAHKTRVIDLLFVEETARRQGLGHALLAAAAKDALHQGCETLIITAQPNNDTANDFYAKCGLIRETKTSARYRGDLKAVEKLGSLKRRSEGKTQKIIRNSRKNML